MKIRPCFAVLILSVCVSSAFGGDGQPVAGNPPPETDPTQLVHSLPNQLVGALPGQVVGSLPGQVVQSLPGQMVQALPGELVGALSGQVVQALPGQLVRSIPYRLSRTYSGVPAMHVQAPPPTTGVHSKK